MPKPEPAPLACTLDLQAMGPRLAEVRRLTREHLRSHRVDGRTLRLMYAVEAAEKVARIVELERVCCAFLDFELRASAKEVELTITAPEQESTHARWLFAQFLPAADPPDAPPLRASERTCCRGWPTMIGVRYPR